MAVAAHERVLRRLAALGRKQRAVGTRADGLEVVLWTGWCEPWGRVQACRLRSCSGRWLDLLEPRPLAALLLGARAWSGAEAPQGERTVRYAVALDCPQGPARYPALADPGWVRMYDARALLGTLGDFGRMQTAARRVVPE